VAWITKLLERISPIGINLEYYCQIRDVFMGDDRNWKTSIGLTAVIDQLDLKIPYPAVRSEVVAGTRKTTVTSTQVLEQYPRVYQPPEGIIGHLRFASAMNRLISGFTRPRFSALKGPRSNAGSRTSPTASLPGAPGISTSCLPGAC